MVLTDLWLDYCLYLETDRKVKVVHATRSRFKLLCQFFKDKEFNRENFNLFLHQKKTSGAKNSYLNCFIKATKSLDKYLDYKFPDYQLQFADFTYFDENRSLEGIEMLTFAEMERIAQAEVFTDPKINHRFFALVVLLSKTGCRITEACTLLKKDVFSDRLCFRYTKNKSDRWVFIDQSLYDLLHSVSDGEYVFSSKGIDPISDRYANDTLVRMAKKAGVKKHVHAHIFRHSFITEMIKQEMPVAMVAQIVGHKDINVTINRYTHLLLTDMQNSLFTYHPLYKSSQTFEMVKHRAKQVVEQVVPIKSYPLKICEDEDHMTITIEKGASHNLAP